MNRNTRTGAGRLALGFGALALLVIAVAVVAVASLRAGIAAHEQVTWDKSPQLAEALHLRFLSEQVVSAERGELLDQTDAGAHNKRAAFRDELEHLRGRSHGDKTRSRLLASIGEREQVHHAAYRSLRDVDPSLARKDLGERFAHEMRPPRELLDHSVAELIGYEERLLARGDRAATRTGETALAVIVLVGALALLLAILVAIGTLRWHRRLLSREADLRVAQRRSFDHVRSVLDTLPAAIVEFDSEFRLRLVNSAGRVWFGEAPEQLVGRTIEETLGEKALPFLPVAEAALAGETQAMEAHVACPDGAERDIRATCVPWREDPDGEVAGFIAFIEDVSEERREQQRERSLAHFTELLFSSLDYRASLRAMCEQAVPSLADCAMLLMKGDGLKLEQIALAHRDSDLHALAADMLRRFPPALGDHVIGKAIASGDPLLVENVDEGMVDRLSRGPEHTEILRRLDLGSLIVVPMKTHGAIMGAIALSRSGAGGRRYNRRDLVFAEELARRAAVAIENARLYQVTRRALESRDEILAVVSHDLRSPLGVIRIKSQLIKERVAALEDARGLNIDVIQRAADQMDALVTSLADATRMNAGRFTIEPAPCDLVALSREVADLLEPVAVDRNVRLEMTTACDDAVCAADRERLLQVLINVMSNGIKFTPPGGMVRLEVVADDDDVEIAVSDTGLGIASDQLSQIFDRYWQGRPGHRGSGLGLYIAKGIIESHGGRIWAESEPGRGSCFRMTLPRGLRESRSGDGDAPLAGGGGRQPSA